MGTYVHGLGDARRLFNKMETSPHFARFARFACLHAWCILKLCNKPHLVIRGLSHQQKVNNNVKGYRGLYRSYASNLCSRNLVDKLALLGQPVSCKPSHKMVVCRGY